MPDDILIRFSVKDDGTPVIERVNEKLRGTKKESQALVPGLEKARKSLTSFAGDNAALIGVLVGVGVALNKVIQDHIKYADQVRTLSTLSGQNTEETSRFIQVLDDYKISADDALVATRALTKNGHAPSIETLAKLSDEYLAINDVEKKNEFILKNLGRGGAAWAEALNKGSKALLEQGAAIDKSLILTQKMVDDARKAEIATDNWSDAVQGLKTSLAVGLLPALTNTINSTMASNRAAEINIEKYGSARRGTVQWLEALEQAEAEQAASTDAMIKNADATATNTEAQQANEEAIKERLKAMTDANQGMLGLIGEIQSAEENYQKASADLNAERIEIEQNKAEEIAKGWAMDKDKIADYDAALEENTRKTQENKAEFDKANLEIISGLVERKLMQDGVLDDAEFEWLIKKRQEWGIYSEDVVAKARAAWQEADKITASIANIPESKTIMITTLQATASVGDRFDAAHPNEHALGGTFMIPSSFGNEGFRMGNGDTASGGETLTVTPKNKDVIDYKKLARVLATTLAQRGG